MPVQRTAHPLTPVRRSRPDSGGTAVQNTIDDLELALGTTGRLVPAVGAARWTAPPPCEGWDVRTLVNHVVGGMRLYTAELTGADAGGAHEDDWLGDDPIAA